MELFKVTVDVDGRNLDIVMKAGVIASVEVGSHKDKVEKNPANKINVIVGQGKSGLAAWVQVAKVAKSNSFQVIHEGWINEGDGHIESCAGLNHAIASLSRVANPSAEMQERQKNVDFSPLDCCTSYGTKPDGGTCYVTCCNSCCSDPVGCPGAGCCA